MGKGIGFVTDIPFQMANGGFSVSRVIRVLELFSFPGYYGYYSIIRIIKVF